MKLCRTGLESVTGRIQQSAAVNRVINFDVPQQRRHLPDCQLSCNMLISCNSSD